MIPDRFSRMASVFLLCGVFGIAASAASADDLALVVNKATPIVEVSSKDLKALYLGETTTLAGVTLRPVNLAAGSPIREAFEKTALHMSSEEFAQHWKAKRFLNAFQKPPAAFKSSQAVKTFVAEEKGTIGYIPAAEVDGSVSVVRKVDGLELGQKTYPLKGP